MSNVLVIDDEESICYSLEVGLRTDELRIHSAGTGRQGLELIADRSPDAVILDVCLPDISGLDLLAGIQQIDPRLPVIIISAISATDTAIKAIKRGAFDYLVKPVNLHHLREKVDRAVELRRLSRVPPAPKGGTDSDAEQLIGNSPAMQNVYKAIGRVAPQDASVLITGESGTGKDLVARALHHHSRRASKPFFAINCTAIPHRLLERELFGHPRDAFADADRHSIGKFERAQGGTLFLDEIGDMSLTVQTKLLRFLQEQHFESLDGCGFLQADVRLLVATNQDLKALVASGKFRQDLFYRLNGFVIDLSPLRDRKDDLPLLADHFRRIAACQLNKDVRAIAPEAMTLLYAHDWPGNVRELQHVIHDGVLQTLGNILTADTLPAWLRGEPSPALNGSLARLVIRHFAEEMLQNGVPNIYRTVVQNVDRVLLDAVLTHVDGNQVHASELLGMSRTTLRAKLAALESSNLSM